MSANDLNMVRCHGERSAESSTEARRFGCQSTRGFWMRRKGPRMDLYGYISFIWEQTEMKTSLTGCFRRRIATVEVIRAVFRSWAAADGYVCTHYNVTVYFDSNAGLAVPQTSLSCLPRQDLWASYIRLVHSQFKFYADEKYWMKTCYSSDCSNETLQTQVMIPKIVNHLFE